MTREEFNDRALSYCLLFSCSEVSGFRTPLHNSEERGVLHSAHLVGLGKDVEPDHPVIAAEAVARGRSLGLKVIIEPTHHHLEPLDWIPG